jgi:hypothetical protein
VETGEIRINPKEVLQMKGKWKRLSMEIRALLVLVSVVLVATMAWATFRGDLLRHAGITYDYAGPIGTTSFEGNSVVKGTLSVYDEITSIGPITFMPNGEVIANVVDAEFTVTGDDNTSDQLILTLRNTTATTNDTDEIKIRAMMDDDEGDEDGFGEISFTADDASSGSEDGSIVFTAITAGTSVTEWIMDGAALYPYIEGGGGIGKTGFGVGNVFINGDTVTTGSVQIGGGNAMAKLWHGTGQINSGASSSTLVIATIDSDDVVVLTWLEAPTTGGLYGKVEQGVGVDVILYDTVGNDGGDTAPDNLSYAYIVIED